MAEEKKRNVRVYEIVYAAVLLILLILAVFSMGNPRIGMVDLKRVGAELGIEETIRAQTLQWRSEAEAEFGRLQGQFAKREKDIRARLDSAESDADKNAARAALAAAAREFQEQIAEVRETLVGKRKEAMGAFRSELQPYITEVARKKRLAAVMEKSGLVYAVGKMDVTDEVIEAARPSFAAGGAAAGTESE